MKRVLLVNTNIEKLPYPVPPLGLCLLAAHLENNYEVRIYDGVFDEGNNLTKVVLEFKPDYIGFSIRNIDDIVQDRHIYYIDRIISDFIEPVKKVTSVPLILGGSGFSIFPQELMNLIGADFGISGEGEVVLSQLLSALDHHDDLDGIPNLYYKGANENFKNSVPALFEQIDGIKFPGIDRFIDFSPYRQRGAYSIQTKRGCAHNCIYCTYPIIEGKKYRLRVPGEFADEIEEVHHRLGDVMFEFVDSTFNDPAGHAEAICRAIIRKKIKVRLRTMGINPCHTGSELFELMIKAGFTQIDATPDSASPRVLKHLGKGFGLKEIERMAILLRQFNLPTMWFFLFGAPGEDEDSFAETIDFIDHFIDPLDLVYMNAGLRVYPGTPLYRIALEKGLILPEQSLLADSVYYFSEKLGKEKLDRMISEASKTRFNCIPALASSPSSEMIKEALELRKNENLQEPMFRTLLRIRRKQTG
ncbi:MAG: radical SAM protein [Bacteroidetes bacterium]|nr:radical SAM protein [Bacteroidota bacterium]